MWVTAHKQTFNRWLEPLARAVAKTGVSPNAITLTVPILITVVCVAFVRTRQVLPFCALVLLFGLCDGLDGAVARVSKRTTKQGAYLDAVADRYVEILVGWATAEVTGYWRLILLVLAGGMLVSYAKARAAMEVPVSNLEWPDLAERTERSLLFLAGLVASRVFSWKPLGHDLFWWVLVLLISLIYWTVVQRVLRACRYIKERS